MCRVKAEAKKLRSHAGRAFHLAYYVVVEHSTIFTGIGDVDTRSFHRHGRNTGFRCLPGCLGDVDARSFH